MQNKQWKWLTHVWSSLKVNVTVHLILLITIGFSSSLYAKSYAQTERFSFQCEASAKDIFSEIMQTSDYLFFYNNDFDVNFDVKLNLKDADINTVIEHILKNKEYSYKLMDNYVIISKKDVSISNQDEKATVRVIEGVVTDKKGETLPGVSILVKGSSWGVATDIDGKYNLAIPVKGATLVFSYVGMKTKEVIVTNQKVVHVVLEDGGQMLEEVLCTGIQTISRERATGSFDLLNADQLNKTLTSDVVSRLDGKIAGVQIDQNNKMTIRGRGSIMSNTEPLVVVGRISIETGISSVNPDDIANITILKDAAAASIWGVRAANGVVVITTKSGSGKSAPTFNVSYTLTVNSKNKIKDLHLLNASEAVDHQLEYIRKNWWQPSAAVNNYHLPVNKVQEAYYNALTDPNRPSGYEGIRQEEQFKNEISKLRNANLYEQFEQELLRKAITNRKFIVIRGGEQSDYYISGVYDYQTQNLGEKNNNLLLNLKHNYKILETLTLSSSVNLQYELGEKNGISTDYLMTEPAFHNLLDEKGKRIQYYMVDPWAGKEREELGYLSYSNNWLNEQEENDKTSDMFNARVMAALNWKIIPSLNVETRFQYERGYANNEELYSIAHPFMRRLINEYTLVDGDKLNHQFPIGAQFTQGTTNVEAWTWRNQLSYNKDWSEGTHRFTGILGHEMRKYKTTARNVTQYGYDENNLNYIPINESDWMSGKYDSWKDGAKLGLNLFNNYQEFDNRDLSIYVNGAYTFSDKYSFTASGRIDQSNIFGNDSKYKYNVIWSAGISWNLGREQFFKKDWIEQFVIRATYGIGGNVNKNFYPVLMGRNEVDANNNLNYIILTNPANKNLKWETTNTINAGIDFGFINGRIYGNVDYYYRKGKDLLGRVSLDPTNGFNSATMNFASLVNSGVEMTINGLLINKKQISWEIGMNMSYNSNRVTKVENTGSSELDYLNMAPSAGSGVAVKDKPLGRLYAYDYAGLDENGNPLLWQQGKKVLYNEYERNSSDLKYMGTTEAPWFGGVNSAIHYKGLTLSANATFKFGHKFRMPVSNVSTSGNGYANIAQRWLKPGDEAHTIVPGLKDFAFSTAQNDIERYYRYADDNVHNAAYFRLNEVSLSYQIPVHQLKKALVRSLEVQLQARNLALWTANKENIDPEAVNIFSNSFMFPQAKSFILGIKATF